MHDAGTSLWFDALCHRQTARVKRNLTLQDQKRHDPGGRYDLTVKYGAEIRNIRLDDMPLELRKRDGPVAYLTGS